jgi:TolA-binding protein
MCKTGRTKTFIGLILALSLSATALSQSVAGQPQRREATAPASRTGRSIDGGMLARAEQRADSLRERLSDLQDRQLELQGRLEDIEYDMTPERIQQALAFVGSVRPMDELREARRTRLETEKARINK